MKKFVVLAIALFSIFALTACGTRGIPDDAVVAACPQGDTFKYVYKDDVVYEFYVNDVLQDKSMLDIVQTSVDNAGTARDYIDATFQEGVCVFSNYSNDKG